MDNIGENWQITKAKIFKSLSEIFQEKGFEGRKESELKLNNKNY